MLSSTAIIDDEGSCTRASSAHTIIPRSGSLTVLGTPQEPESLEVQAALQSAIAFEERVEALERELALADMRVALDPNANCACGVTADGEVSLKLTADGVQFVGRNECRITTVCPRCAKKRLWTQRYRLEDLLFENREAGGQAILVSLSLDFPDGLPLEDRWEILMDMWDGLTKSTRRRRNAAGVLRRARVVHLLYGENAWHVHLHALYFLARPISDSDANTLAEVEAKTWSKLARQHGCDADSDIQTYTVIGDTDEDVERVSSYLTKAVEELEFDRGIESPMATCKLERKNKSPWQLLNDAALRGETTVLKALRDWMRVMTSGTFKQQSIPTEVNYPAKSAPRDNLEAAA